MELEKKLKITLGLMITMWAINGLILYIKSFTIILFFAIIWMATCILSLVYSINYIKENKATFLSILSIIISIFIIVTFLIGVYKGILGV